MIDNKYLISLIILKWTILLLPLYVSSDIINHLKIISISSNYVFFNTYDI